eukprot:1157731-Pelagomonas_calceolata.AAC.18
MHTSQERKPILTLPPPYSLTHTHTHTAGLQHSPVALGATRPTIDLDDPPPDFISRVPPSLLSPARQPPAQPPIRTPPEPKLSPSPQHVRKHSAHVSANFVPLFVNLMRTRFCCIGLCVNTGLANLDTYVAWAVAQGPY